LRLCAADAAFFYRLDGDAFILDAAAGSADALAPSWLSVGSRLQRDSAGIIRLAFDQHRTFHVSDMASEEARVLVAPGSSPEEWVERYTAGQRSRLAVPVLYDNGAIGVIRVHRTEPGGFTRQQIGLVESFAAQAAIAIRNVRLFTETKEALERQTATSEVLKAISDSAFELQPMFDKMLRTAARICRADYGFLYDIGDARHLSSVRMVASFNVPEEEVRRNREVVESLDDAHRAVNVNRGPLNLE